MLIASEHSTVILITTAIQCSNLIPADTAARRSGCDAVLFHPTPPQTSGAFQKSGVVPAQLFHLRRFVTLILIFLLLFCFCRGQVSGVVKLSVTQEVKQSRPCTGGFLCMWAESRFWDTSGSRHVTPAALTTIVRNGHISSSGRVAARTQHRCACQTEEWCHKYRQWSTHRANAALSLKILKNDQIQYFWIFFPPDSQIGFS